MEQITMGEVTSEYQAFVDKFKPKLTTDDCYTPPLVYEAVADWTAQTYGLDKSNFVRPFWPSGDYQRFDYPEGCVVVDNPPFSILAEIVNWYCSKGIRFLLFNQHTTGLKGYAIANRCTILAAGVGITYANGAQVNTGFLTNLEQEYIIRSVPDLTAMVEAANAENLKEIHKQHPKYSYIGTWRDYLRELEELGEADDEARVFPRDLLAAHVETTTRIKIKADEAQQKKLDDRLPELRGKYSFRAGGLVLEPFWTVAEVIAEGAKQRICIASYAGRYANGGTVLCKLRRESAPETPWHAVEFDTKGRMMQCRGEGNTTAPEDEQAVRDFWAAWDAAHKTTTAVHLTIRARRTAT